MLCDLDNFVLLRHRVNVILNVQISEMNSQGDTNLGDHIHILILNIS